MHPLESYLEELSAIRSSGAVTKETSGYPALANLFNAAGSALKPKVRCFIHPRNSGAGNPDGGFFTQDQWKQQSGEEPLNTLLPARGVIEVKSVGEELAAITDTEQVKEYVARYGLALVTNYRDFILLKRGKGWKPQPMESFHLAHDEAAFWKAAAHPRQTAAALGERFNEYLKRVLLHAAPLNSPRDVAFFLASYARDARGRVEAAGDLPALTAVRTALEEALGMKFEAQRGEHFFRSTLVQTLFYGVFSAWVLWHKENPQRPNDFDWRAAAWTLHVPMIRALFEQLATPTKLGPLGLVEVLDWTAAALNRVDRPEFFARFVEEQAVQYFYEPFLEAFDPDLRKELGVWYTPPEIVKYMVARVDTVLREELDVPDGLADSRVFVLDPCCGTGAYLVEVLRRIVKTLKDDKGEGALALAEAKQAAMKRVYGFEIMPAPFVVAHLQMGLLLQNLGAPLDEAHGERAGIFLTNALTGWDFAGDIPALAGWPQLQEERKGAGQVKSRTPILVILGNPPYNAFAGVSPQEEQGLVELYKEGLVKEWGIKKFNLDDLYVRFFRIAERKIAEKTGKGIVSFISNFSYLGDPSFVVMRQRFLKEFDALWFDCLNGDSRETGKLTPDGNPDPSVFSTESNREGIRVGTTVGLMVRKPERTKTARVHYRDFWGVNKRAAILESLNLLKSEQEYNPANPGVANRFSFRPARVARGYLRWPKVVEFAGETPISGLQEMRRGSLMAFDPGVLKRRMAMYFDPSQDWEAIKRLRAGPTENGGAFVAKEARTKLLKTESFTARAIVRYALYPFDLRWAYYSDAPPLWNRPRPKLVAQQWRGNEFFVTRMFAERPNEQVPVIVTKALPDYHLLRPNAVAIPFRLRSAPKSKSKKDDGNGEFDSMLREMPPESSGGDGKTTANLSPAARAYLAKLGFKDLTKDADIAALLWLHALAIGYSPAYLAENANGIRQDWPRVPLPDSKVALLASARLGRQVTDLLDTESPVAGVTSGKLRPELKAIAELHAQAVADFRVTAGWGHAGKEGVTMPGKGKLETHAETASTTQGLPWFEFHDVYLNETTCWQGIPKEAWEFTIGGYQVIKKWLSYRELELLGRPLTADEVREVTHMARRIAALLLLQSDLDGNYEQAKQHCVEWKP